MFYQLVYQNKHRFANLVTDENNMVSMPILAGDSISFNYNVNPAPGQNELTGVPPFEGRQYRIQLIVDAGSGVNTVPDDN